VHQINNELLKYPPDILFHAVDHACQSLHECQSLPMHRVQEPTLVELCLHVLEYPYVDQDNQQLQRHLRDQVHLLRVVVGRCHLRQVLFYVVEECADHFTFDVFDVCGQNTVFDDDWGGVGQGFIFSTQHGRDCSVFSVEFETLDAHE